MSQVLLGVRNLTLRIAVFVALAAVLVWFLGGNLLPKQVIVASEAHVIGSPGEGEAQVRLVQAVDPIDLLQSDRVSWRVELKQNFGRWQPCEGQDACAETTRMIDAKVGVHPCIWFAGRAPGSDAWTIYTMGPYASRPVAEASFIDRLEAERQLARIASGLAVQTAEVASGARDAVLKAGDAQ